MAMLWDEARRQLVRQEAVLDTLRTQAVAVLSVASIVAGLFGPHVVTANQAVAAATAAALVVFAATATLTIVILWPRTWFFSHTFPHVLGMVETQTVVNADDLSYTWAKAFEEWRATNTLKLDRLFRCFTWACGLTGLQVMAWGLAILQPRLFP